MRGRRYGEVADGRGLVHPWRRHLRLYALQPYLLELDGHGLAGPHATDPGGQAVALAVFVVLGALGPGIPVAVYFLMGDRAAHILDDLKSWLGLNNAAIMAVICLVIGAKLIGDGISGL
jgi:hypothetical protein